jgi:signal transduction histidine kinase
MDSQNSSLFQQEHQVLEYLTALSYRTGDLGTYLNEIVRGVSLLIHSDWTIVTICEGETGRVVASSMDMGEGDRGFSIHGTLVDEITQTGRSLIIEDIRKEVRKNKPAQEYLCYLGIPLRTFTGEVIGTICSFLQEPRPFSEAEVRAVELFAERAATAIDNYRLYQQQKQFNERLEQEVAVCTIDLKVSQDKLIERERLAAIGEFTAMIVHEVRNPLTTIMMGLTHAQKKMHDEADQKRLALSLDESFRLKRLLNEILLYAKPQVLDLSRLSMSEFLTDVLIQIKDLPEAADRSIDYVKGLPEVEIVADINKLKQVFLNLFQNAFEAIGPHGTVHCSIENSIDANRICIRIHNGGQRIPAELLSQLATPFCSTKTSGTGLGLAISKRIITAHGGELEIASSNSGTTVSIHLPIVCSDV